MLKPQYEAYTLSLGAYASIRIPVEASVGYVNGDAPHLIIRDGSDAKRLTQGQSIPIDSGFATINNPFPRPVECLISRGLPVSTYPEPIGMTSAQRMVVNSGFNFMAVTQGAGIYNACGFVMKRGRAIVSVSQNKLYPAGVAAIIFGATSIGINAGKPAGMALVNVFNFADGLPDTSITAFSGTFLSGELLTWATGQAGTRTLVDLNFNDPFTQKFEVSAGKAFIFYQQVTQPVDAYLAVEHLGAEVGEYD